MTDELAPFLTPNNTFRPDYVRDIPGVDGEVDMSFPAVVTEAMRQGYGCSGCLRYYGGVYMDVCPDCGKPRDSFVLVRAWYV